jgi:hypothetical protein
MTRAQYDRALGAQLQSKAGDQWAYFQAKKLRGAMQRNSLELLTATTEVKLIENPVLDKIPVPAPTSMDATVAAALEAIEQAETRNRDRRAFEARGRQNPRRRTASRQG